MQGRVISLSNSEVRIGSDPEDRAVEQGMGMGLELGLDLGLVVECVWEGVLVVVTCVLSLPKYPPLFT